jgi:hypothetical protein
MKTNVTVLMALCIMLASGIYAASKYGDEVLGIKFGADKKEIEKAFPRGAFDKDGDYQVNNPAPQYSLAWYIFTSAGKLYSVILVCDTDWLVKAGDGDLTKGFGSMVDKLVNKYGKANVVNTEGSGSVDNPKVITSSWDENGGVVLLTELTIKGSIFVYRIQYTSIKVKADAAKDAASNIDYGY